MYRRVYEKESTTDKTGSQLWLCGKGWTGDFGRSSGNLPKFCDPNLLVGTDTSDDAAVYKVSDDLAMIQTLDFFTPVADDPYDFGQIAAANALSDVYAMGGVPKTALNIVAFPKNMDVEILGEILRGGADKVMEQEQFLQADILFRMIHLSTGLA